MPPFDPAEFLQVVEGILSEERLHTEGYLRTAIGRAYYAAHLTARELLLAQSRIGRDRKGKTRHGAVIRALNKPGTDLAASALDSLMLLRERADYNLSHGVGLESAREAADLAGIVLETLSPK